MVPIVLSFDTGLELRVSCLDLFGPLEMRLSKSHPQIVRKEMTTFLVHLVSTRNHLIVIYSSYMTSRPKLAHL